MRILFGLVLLILVAVAGLWLGGEAWLARQVVAQAVAQPGVSLAAAAPLRAPPRIGVTLSAPSFDDGTIGLSMPSLDLWLSPFAPGEARASLPETATLTMGGRDHPLSLTGGALGLGVSVLHGGAFRRASAQAATLTLDGAPLAEAVSLDARMTGLGHDAPREARAAYDITLMLAGMRPDALATLGVPPAALPGTVDVAGPLRVWLGAILDLGLVAGDRAAPPVIGLRSEGIEVVIGGAAARVAGTLRRGADGLAEGRLAIYSRNGDAWLRAAAEAGMIPAEGAMLASALLAGLGRLSFPEGDDGAMALPEPAADEVRLPLVMRGGRLLLGDIDLGAAPALDWLP